MLPAAGMAVLESEPARDRAWEVPRLREEPASWAESSRLAEKAREAPSEDGGRLNGPCWPAACAAGAAPLRLLAGLLPAGEAGSWGTEVAESSGLTRPSPRSRRMADSL